MQVKLPGRYGYTVCMRAAAGLTALSLAAAACSAGHPAPGSPAQAAKPLGPAPPLQASIAAETLARPVSRDVLLPDGRDLLILGGLDRAGQSVPGVYRLDPSSGTVTRAGRLAQPTHDAAGAVIHGADVVFGGGVVSSTATVQTWRQGAAGRVTGHLPSVRSDLAAATVGSTTYLVGGYDGSHWSSAVLATTDGARFRVAARLPVPVRYAAVAAVGGRIIVAGGLTPSGEVRSIQEIDPATGQARILGKLPTALAHAAALVLGGHLYVAGGDAGGGASDRIWAIDPGTGKVTPAGTLPMGISDAGAATVGSTGYLVGGTSRSALASVVVLRAGQAAARCARGTATGSAWPR